MPKHRNLEASDGIEPEDTHVRFLANLTNSCMRSIILLSNDRKHIGTSLGKAKAGAVRKGWGWETRKKIGHVRTTKAQYCGLVSRGVSSLQKGNIKTLTQQFPAICSNVRNNNH